MSLCNYGSRTIGFTNQGKQALTYVLLLQGGGSHVSAFFCQYGNLISFLIILHGISKKVKNTFSSTISRMNHLHYLCKHSLVKFHHMLHNSKTYRLKQIREPETPVVMKSSRMSSGAVANLPYLIKNWKSFGRLISLQTYVLSFTSNTATYSVPGNLEML